LDYDLKFRNLGAKKIMNKPKAQTLQQKLGFFDEDLKKPKHDELMLWLDNNIENVINKLFNSPFSDDELKKIRDTEEKKVNEILKNYKSTINSCQRYLDMPNFEKRDLPPALRRSNEELNQTINRMNEKIETLTQFDIYSAIPIKPRIKKINKRWELPVSTGNFGNKYTIGFIDFSATFNIPYLELQGLKFSQKEHSHKIDYYDFIEDELRFAYTPVEKTIFVEVKTEISSLGELIRQINHYKSYLKGDYYVLCPDDKYKEVLLEQEIKFIDFE